MKKWLPLSLLSLAVLLLFFSDCTKSAVQRRTLFTDTTARETFRCRINGTVYPPNTSNPASVGICQYISIYAGDSGWVFKIGGDRHQIDCRTYSVSITLDSVKLQRGQRFVLGTEGFKKNYGTYYLADACAQHAVELYTKDTNPGLITITDFNPYDSLVAGTFHFSVVDDSGNEYNISNGSFKRHFTN